MATDTAKKKRCSKASLNFSQKEQIIKGQRSWKSTKVITFSSISMLLFNYKFYQKSKKIFD